jgi:hypothetical protein
MEQPRPKIAANVSYVGETAVITLVFPPGTLLNTSSGSPLVSVGTEVRLEGERRRSSERLVDREQPQSRRHAPQRSRSPLVSVGTEVRLEGERRRSSERLVDRDQPQSRQPPQRSPPPVAVAHQPDVWVDNPSWHAERPTEVDAVPARVGPASGGKKMWLIPSLIAGKTRPAFLWAKVRKEGAEGWPDPDYHTPSAVLTDTPLRHLKKPKKEIMVFPDGGPMSGTSLMAYLESLGVHPEKRTKKAV